MRSSDTLEVVPRLLAAGLFELIAFAVGGWVAMRVAVAAGAVAGGRPQPTFGDLITALTLSSFGKLFVFWTVVWPYPVSFLASINLFVRTSNFVAVRALLGAPAPLPAVAVVLAGSLASWAAKFALSLAGLSDTLNVL